MQKNHEIDARQPQKRNKDDEEDLLGRHTPKDSVVFRGY
jgi:hypothetical protein